MKKELKILYRKDPILAKKVAKILGYKVSAVDSRQLKIKILTPLEDAQKLATKAFQDFERIIGEDYPKKFDDAGLQVLAGLATFISGLKKKYM